MLTERGVGEASIGINGGAIAPADRDRPELSGERPGPSKERARLHESASSDTAKGGEDSRSIHRDERASADGTHDRPLG